MGERAGLSDLLAAFGIITTVYAISQAIDKKKTIAQAAAQNAKMQAQLTAIEDGIRSLHARIS